MSYVGPRNSVAPAPQDELVGTLLADKYRVERLLASGGMGRIYVATQLMLNRQVAIKVLNASLVQMQEGQQSDNEQEQRFLREAAICAQLTHNNTVHVYDYGSLIKGDERILYMVMELIHGITLRQRLDAIGPFTPEQALYIIREVARSLNEAHRMGIVHRDLKPSNIMLVPNEGDNDAVKVLDFGIAKLLESHETASDLTGQDRMIGTPRYMAPEMVIHGAIDHRSDIYSLGVLLYELLCGKTPFDGEPIAIAIAHVNNPPPPIFELTGKQIPSIVEEIAFKCMRKNPAERYQTAIELMQAIDVTVDRMLMPSGMLPNEMSEPSVFSAAEVSGITEAPTRPPKEPSASLPNLTSQRLRPPSGSMPDVSLFGNPNTQAVVAPTGSGNRSLPIVMMTGEHHFGSFKIAAQDLGQIQNTPTSPLPTSQVLQMANTIAELAKQSAVITETDITQELPQEQTLPDPPKEIVEEAAPSHRKLWILLVLLIVLGAVIVFVVKGKSGAASTDANGSQTPISANGNQAQAPSNGNAVQPAVLPADQQVNPQDQNPVVQPLQPLPSIPDAGVKAPAEMPDAAVQDNAVPSIQVAPANNKLKIASTPEGASVYENKKLLCKTPCSIEQTDKARELTFNLKGYAEKKETVKPGSSEVTVKLESSKAKSSQRNPKRKPLRER